MARSWIFVFALFLGSLSRAAIRADELYRPVSESWKPVLERALNDPDARDRIAAMLGSDELPAFDSDAWSPVVAELAETYTPQALLARADAADIFIDATVAGRRALGEDVREASLEAAAINTSIDQLPGISARLLRAHERLALIAWDDQLRLSSGLDSVRQRYWHARGADLLAKAGSEVPRLSLFPQLVPSNSEGLVTKYVPMTPETVIEGLRVGVFPRSEVDGKAAWYSPQSWGVLDIDELHVSKSLAKLKRRGRFTTTIDQEFELVARRCAVISRSGEGSGRWISERFLQTFIEMHRKDFAHSVEVWDGDRLVGGLFGVFLNGVFSGASMFHLEANTSKLALVALADHLRSRGIAWIDTHMVTSIMGKMGAKFVSRAEYLRRIRLAAQNPISFR